MDYSREIKKYRTLGYVLIIFDETKIILKSKASGIVKLLEILNKQNEILNNKIVFDEIVGVASASLLIFGNVKKIIANQISQHAIRMLDSYGYEYFYENLVPFILNKNKDGLCPFESLAIGKKPAEFFFAVKDRLLKDI